MQKSIKFIYAALMITLIGGGAALYVLYYQKGFVPEEYIQDVNKLPTSFRVPLPDGLPHIAGAKIETIPIPCFGGESYNPSTDCGSADILKSADGLSEKTIIEINDGFTNGIFGHTSDTDDTANAVDIRDPKNRKQSFNVGSIDRLENKILYIDKGFISTYSSLEAYYEGAAHPTRDPGSYSLINLADTRELVIFDTDYLYPNKDKVLKHFYPNGQKLLVEYIKKEKGADLEAEACYSEFDFPSKFWPTVRPNTKEVVFRAEFPYVTIGVCSPGLEIAIPIADVLKEVPEYVPKDSVLLKLGG